LKAETAMNELITIGAQVLGFAATAGVVSAILGYFLTHRAELRRKKLENAYTAIRLAVIFEKYASECTDVIMHNDHYEAVKGKSVSPVTDLPVLSELPGDDAGWRGLSSGTVAESLSFPLRIKLAQEIIQSAFVHAEQADAVQEASDQAVILGTLAWKLAGRLRSEHSFEPFRPEFPFQQCFLDKFPSVSERRRGFGSNIGIEI